MKRPIIRVSLALTLLLSLLPPFVIWAKIPEPGNIIYGTVTMGDVLIGSLNKGVSVSLRVNDTLVASYTMGDDSKVGDNYLLKVSMDSVGDRLPNSARPGDTAQLLVNNQLAETFIINTRGDTLNKNLTVDLICESQTSGILLSAGTYGGLDSCNSPDNEFIIANGHTVTWDGSNGPLSGSITIHPGGIFQITGTDGIISGTVQLAGGTLSVNGNTEIASVIQSYNSVILIAAGRKLTVIDSLEIPNQNTLQIDGYGTLAVSGTFTLNGTYTPGNSILDLRGADLQLGSDLNMSGAQLITDETLNVTLNNDVVITTDQAFTIGTLTLNQHSLTLGSESSDLTIVNTLVLNDTAEKIISNNADITFLSAVTMIDGEIQSSGGRVTFNDGGTLSGGTLDLRGTTLVADQALDTSGTNLVTDDSTQSKPVVVVSGDFSTPSGISITMDGAGSYDIDGMISSFQWTQIQGSSVTLINSTTSKPSFQVPYIGQQDTDLVFVLQVTDDDGLSSTKSVTITVLGGVFYSVDFSKSGMGTITNLDAGVICGTECSSKTAAYAENTTVRISASPEAGYVFAGWSGACEGSSVCELVMNANKSLSAPFTQATIVTQSIVDSGLLSAANSPYRVDTDLVIGTGKTLVIESGVQLYFGSGIGMTVEGTLEVQGTEPKPVLISAVDMIQNWGGIVLASNVQTSTSISYLTIEQATIAIEVACCGQAAGGLMISNSIFRKNDAAIKGYASYNVSIDHSVIDENTYGLLGTKNILVSNSTFSNNSVALSKGEGEIQYSQLSGNEVAVESFPKGYDLHNNLISNNTVGIMAISPAVPESTTLALENNNILSNSEYGFKNSSGEAFSIPNNWWGSTNESEIALKIYDRVDDNSLGLVTYTPVLTEEASVVNIFGYRGDIDGDGSINGGDTNRLKLCITHKQFMGFGATEEQANSALDITYGTDCQRLSDMNGDELINGGDTTRHLLCVTHKQFMGFGATEEQANQALDIIYNQDCSLLLSTQ